MIEITMILMILISTGLFIWFIRDEYLIRKKKKQLLEEQNSFIQDVERVLNIIEDMRIALKQQEVPDQFADENKIIPIEYEDDSGRESFAPISAQNTHPEPHFPKQEVPEIIGKGTSKTPKPENTLSDYKSRFLSPVPETARNGKSMTIRKQYHDHIMLIIHSFGKDISLFAYVDNVLTQHFEENKEQIKDLISRNVRNNLIQ